MQIKDMHLQSRLLGRFGKWRSCWKRQHGG